MSFAAPLLNNKTVLFTKLCTSDPCFLYLRVLILMKKDKSPPRRLIGWKSVQHRNCCLQASMFNSHCDCFYVYTLKAIHDKEVQKLSAVYSFTGNKNELLCELIKERMNKGSVCSSLVAFYDLLQLVNVRGKINATQ